MLIHYSRDFLFVLALVLILGLFDVKAENTSCLDNLDCAKGEICIDKGGSPQGECVKRCASLRMRLVTDGVEPYTTEDGSYTQYKLKIINWQSFGDYLFTPSPDLPPCGQNTNSSRSWVSIYDTNTDQKIYEFCALGNAEHLTKLWFGVKQTAAPLLNRSNIPESVYVIMEDRLTGKIYCSNEVEISE